MRIKGLEPPRLSASDPKSDVATNYTISACRLISATCPPRIRLAKTSRLPCIHFASASFLPSALHLLRSDFSSAPHLLHVGFSHRPPRIRLAQTSRPPRIHFASASFLPSALHLLRSVISSAPRPPLTGPGDESYTRGNHVTNQRKVNKNNTSTRSVRIKNWVFAFFLVTFVTN